MIKILRNITLLALLVLAVQCKKETPGSHVDYSGDVVFHIHGSVAGKPFDYKAGEENYVMSTTYSFQDSVVEMKGALLPEGKHTQSGFEIRLRGQQRVATTTAFDLSQNLNAGKLALRDATGFRKETGKYLLSLSCDSTQGQYSSHLWIFPDGSFSNAYELEKTIDVSAYPQYPVRLVTSGMFSCQSEVYHEINLAESCDAGFDLIMLANFTAQVNLKNIQGNIDLVKWYHNDSLVTPSAINHTIYLGNNGEPHTIRCEVYFTDGCEKVIERVVSANFAVNCMTDFSYQSRKEVVFDPRQLSTAELIYYDAQGKKYSSHYPNAQGEFELISFSPYDVNADGNPTVIIQVKAQAILKSADGSSVSLSNIEGSFALAHP